MICKLKKKILIKKKKKSYMLILHILDLDLKKKKNY